jgi:hypothetical protein
LLSVWGWLTGWVCTAVCKSRVSMEVYSRRLRCPAAVMTREHLAAPNALPWLLCAHLTHAMFGVLLMHDYPLALVFTGPHLARR